ncbi:hypothetical protein AHiyo4_49830 [Arthrobacter sp. Hiyo4]|nr:hypothetical protein AHiyo4_49830 [Arthrobacter sp. Hiyo4]
MPKNTAITPGTQRPVSTPRDRPITSAAAVRMAVPMMGKIRYVPDAEMVRPAVMEPVRMPRVKVIIIRPASVGVSPLTSCRYMGSMAMARTCRCR